MTDQERVESLGGFDPPLFFIDPHPFELVEGNRYCGRCGGGIMHPVHEAQGDHVAA